MTARTISKRHAALRDFAPSEARYVGPSAPLTDPASQYDTAAASTEPGYLARKLAEYRARLLKEPA